jgi:cytoskeletal protein CcmA (bactofilin family)
MPPPLNGTAAPAAASRSYAAPTGNVSSSVIGTDLTVLGNLQSKGEIQIEGTVQGDIQAARIIVGPAARITGGVVADDVVVQGTVMGSIRGNRVTLQSSSKVEGDVFHQSLAIEQGAFFEGKSRRSDDPTAVNKPAGEVSHIFGTPGVGSTG